MNYHNIKHCDMNNGDGLRVTLFVSGCSHKCHNCHNPQTWDPDSGILFTDKEKKEIFDELDKDYIAGITFSGGDPLFKANRETVTALAKEIKEKYPNKTIWLYTGYKFEDVYNLPIMKYIDILVDGRFVESLYSPSLHWVGSSNQRVIDVKRHLAENISK